MLFSILPQLLRLYLLRAKVYRRLNLWEQALSDLEIIFSAGIQELAAESNKLIFCILNDFGVACIQTGAYEDAIILFNASLNHVKGWGRKIFLFAKIPVFFSGSQIFWQPI